MKLLDPEEELLAILGTALGPQISALLLDDQVTEVRRNSDGGVWVN
jgi:hypothetical protein